MTFHRCHKGYSWMRFASLKRNILFFAPLNQYPCLMEMEPVDSWIWSNVNKSNKSSSSRRGVNQSSCKRKIWFKRWGCQQLGLRIQQELQLPMQERLQLRLLPPLELGQEKLFPQCCKNFFQELLPQQKRRGGSCPSAYFVGQERNDLAQTHDDSAARCMKGARTLLLYHSKRST